MPGVAAMTRTSKFRMWTTAANAPSANSEISAEGNSHFQARSIPATAPNNKTMPTQSRNWINRREPPDSPMTKARKTAAIRSAVPRAAHRTIVQMIERMKTCSPQKN